MALDPKDYFEKGKAIFSRWFAKLDDLEERVSALEDADSGE